MKADLRISIKDYCAAIASAAPPQFQQTTVPACSSARRVPACFKKLLEQMAGSRI
jgi:hypothetical protein